MDEPDPTKTHVVLQGGVAQKGDSRLTPEGREALLALVESDELADALDADGDAMNDMSVLLSGAR